MNLKDCTIGLLVYTEDFNIGHIVDFTFNLGDDAIRCSNLTKKDLMHRVIPVVKFVGEDMPRSIHYKNIKKVNW